MCKGKKGREGMTGRGNEEGRQRDGDRDRDRQRQNELFILQESHSHRKPITNHSNHIAMGMSSLA